MQVDRNEAERSLRKKGFVEENSHHRYFHHEFQGKRTGIFTYTSHGTQYKALGSPLLSRMKKELKLDSSNDAFDLLCCPMSGENYNRILAAKGLIPSHPA